MTRKIIFPILLSFFFFSCGNKDGKSKVYQKKDTVSIPQPIKIKTGLIDGTEISLHKNISGIYGMGRIGDTLIYCSEKGKIEIADTLHKIRHQLVDLKVPILMDQLYVIPRANEYWFFVWQETFQEGIRTYAALYKSGSPKPEWKIMFPVPNPGRPVVDGDDAYVSALGIVAKIGLNEGKVIWKRDSLFNQSRFSYQKMEKAIVYPDKIIFVDFPVSGFREVRDSLILDPITGVRKK